MTDPVETATVKAGGSPRVAEPHEHFVELPTRLWKILLVGGTAIWLFSASSPR